jgi:XisI protein
MDKINDYQTKIIALLNEYICQYDAKNPELKDEVICDYQNKHFQLVTSGWEDNRYRYTISFHFHIKNDGKVWLLVNNTDVRIAEELVNKGVPRTDIVLGFQRPIHRQFTDFATA